MNSLSLILGYILLYSLFVWVFISNDLYLKLFFLKSKKKDYRKLSENDTDKFFFEQAYGGIIIPKYIKNAILKSQDKHKLLALYLASQNITDIGLYLKIAGSSNIDRYKECAKYISKGKHKLFNIVLNSLRFVAVLIFLWLLFVFLSHVFFSADTKIQTNDQFIMTSIICITILLPYRVYSEYIFLNRMFALASFMSSILLSFFIIYYFNDYSGKFLFNKDLFSIILTSLIILLGAYSFVGYLKIEYLVKFFELLEVNSVQNNDDR
ncbi:hypothetical protein [Acinetobacter junii]|uniref:hypothetical protein n=1 Tax=Acinetobacter junii TaxID=40215 RepID=UPI003215FC96